MEKVKLTLKEKLIKGLEIRSKNLKKKLTTCTVAFKEEKQKIEEELQVVEIQLKALVTEKKK